MKQLVQQLSDQARSSVPQGLPADQWIEAYNQQLVKLVVDKCVGAVEGLSPGYDDYRNQIEDAFRRDCVEKIKHMFGVEE